MTTTDTDSPAPAKRLRRSRASSVDAEAKAIGLCHTALKELPKEAVTRVLDYVKQRLGVPGT